MSDNQPPRRGDVVFLADDSSFTYVESSYGDFPGTERFEILDPHGESYIVVRATERDDELRAAVHDDGQRRAWRTAKA